MPETLVIRLPQETGGDAQWTVIDDTGTRIGDVHDGPLAEAADAQLQRQVLVLVPGTRTISAQARLPVRGASKMLQVVPFALEDQLASDVTRMHFALGKRNADGEVGVVAVDKDTMGGWMDALKDAGISARRMLADSAGVPVTENGMSVVILTQEAYLRERDGCVFAVDHHSVVATLELLGQPPAEETANEIVAVDTIDADFEDSPNDAGMPINVYLDDTSGTIGENLLVEISASFPDAQFRRLPNGLLPRMGAEASHSDAPDLLQGEYAANTNLTKYWQPWRTAAGLAAGLVLVGLTVKGAELFTYKSRYARLSDQIAQVYTDVLGGQSVPDNPRLVFERRLRPNDTSTGGSDFLDGLQVLAQSMPVDADAVVTTINFNAGVMNLEILAADIPTLDALRERISQTPPWQARLTQTSPEDDKIEGRLQLQRSAP